MSRQVNNSNSQANMPNNQKYNKEDAYKNLDRINMWIGNVDAKISYSLTFIGVLLGFFLTGNKSIKMEETINKIYFKGVFYLTPKEVVIIFLICAFAITSVIAIIFLYRALKGRINPNVYKETGLITNSNIFWLTISKKKYIDFYNEANNLTQENLMKDICSQIFINSKICTEKFENYNKGVRFIVISVIIFFIFKIAGCVII